MATIYGIQAKIPRKSSKKRLGGVHELSDSGCNILSDLSRLLH